MPFEFVDEKSARKEVESLIFKFDTIKMFLNVVLGDECESYDYCEDASFVYEQVLIGLYGHVAADQHREETFGLVVDTLLNKLALGDSSRQIVQTEREIVDRFGFGFVDERVRKQILSSTIKRIELMKKYLDVYENNPFAIDINVMLFGTQEGLLAAMVRAGLHDIECDKQKQ